MNKRKASISKEEKECGPLISIIIPVYNSSRTLDRCIRSVCSQTYEKWEIIIVDSESSDRTPHIAKKWFNKLGERCRYYDIKKRNIALARNFGVRKSKGETILTLESDVYLTPRVLEDCVIKAYGKFDGVKLPTYLDLWLNKGYISACRWYASCRKGDPNPAVPNFISRKVWLTLGGQDEELGSVLEDLDFGIKFRRQGYRSIRIEEHAIHDANFSLKHLVLRSIYTVLGERRLVNKWKEVGNLGTGYRAFFILERLRFLIEKQPKFLPGVLLITLIAAMGRGLGALLSLVKKTISS